LAIPYTNENAPLPDGLPVTVRTKVPKILLRPLRGAGPVCSRLWTRARYPPESARIPKAINTAQPTNDSMADQVKSFRISCSSGAAKTTNQFNGSAADVAI